MGFENPAWLLGVGLIAPLVWLYLRVQPRPPAMVSSLRIWRHVPSPAAPPRRKPKLPPIFFLQALLIVISSIALAEPYQRKTKPPGPPRDAVLIIDVSASMQSRSGTTTRFAEAIESATKRARTLAGEGRRITVIRAGPQPEVIASGLDAAGAEAEFATLEALDTSSNLTAAIELGATLAGREGSIDVFSDRESTAIVMSRDAREAATVHVFGEPGENVAVQGVNVQTNPFGNEATARVLVTVRNHSAEPRTVRLEVVPLEESLEPTDPTEAAFADPGVSAGPAPDSAVDSAERAANGDEPTEIEPPGAQLVHTLALDGEAQEIVSIDAIRWTGAFEARIDARDDLALDDVVYGYIPRPRAIDLLLVSDDARLSDRLSWLAERAGSFAVRSVRPSEYDPQDAGEVTLFDRFVPKLPPTSNVAYLAPQTGNADVTVLQEPGELKIAERRDHPLLRGVKTTPKLLGTSPIGLAPSALRPVLLGRSGGREIALVQAGEVGGRQIVTTAFRISPDSLRRADDLPTLIFTLNLLSFLTPEAVDAPLLRMTGERLRAGSSVAAPIESLEGPDGRHDLGAGADFTLNQSGVYEAKSRTGTRPLYVSFADATESNIQRPSVSRADPATTTTGAIPAGESATAESDENWIRIPYLREILIVLALLLVSEWLLVALLNPGRGRPAKTSS